MHLAVPEAVPDPVDGASKPELAWPRMLREDVPFIGINNL